MNRLRTPRIALAVALAGSAVLTQANESGLLALETSDLMFSINSSVDLGIFPIAAEQGGSEIVRYDLADGSVQFIVANPATRYSDPLICFDYAGNSGAVRLEIKDANDHLVADMALGSELQYILDSPEIRMSPASDVQCFYHGYSSGEFGLFGQESVVDGEDNGETVFADRFEPIAGVRIEFLDLPAFVKDGQFINYRLKVSNTGNSDLDEISFQELLPRNASQFDAILTTGSWNCSPGNEAVCPSGDNSDPVRFEKVFLPSDGYLTFNFGGRLVLAEQLGSVIDLHSAVVSGPGPLAAFDVAQATLTIVGDGETLSAEPAQLEVEAGSEATVTVTALDPASNPVPGVEIDVFTDIVGDGDLGDDDLEVTPIGSETNADGQMQFIVSATQADDYQLLFAADGMQGTESNITVTAADPATISASAVEDEPNAGESVVFHVELEDTWGNMVSGAWVEVVDDDGLEDLEGAAELTTDGLATFSASSTVADEFTVTFGVDGLDATASASVSFVPAPAASVGFFQQPSDTDVGENISPPVVVRTYDQFGNWTEDDNETELELTLRGGGLAFPVFLVVEHPVINGQAGFEGLLMEDVGEDFYLRVSADFEDGDNNSTDSQFFDVIAYDQLNVALAGFDGSYAQGENNVGSEAVAFTYNEGQGDVEQIFNVFRIYDENGELSPGQYDALFVSVGFGPAGYEDYIRGLSGTTEDNVVAPESVDVEVMFELDANAPPGEYELEITSYDVTGIPPADVSLGNVDDYPVLDIASTDIEIEELPPEPDSVSVALADFLDQYSQGAVNEGAEKVEFTYEAGDGDIEQIFNVFRIYDENGELSPGEYDALFVSVGFGPAGYEDYIRGLSGTTEDNVVAPESVDVEVMFELEANAPPGEYELEITSYDVTGIPAEDVSLEDANNGDYAVLDVDNLTIDIHVP